MPEVRAPGSIAALYLVRHGQTALNAAGVLRGRLDPPLDEVGRAQAETLGQLFATVVIEIVVTSPLAGARETARSMPPVEPVRRPADRVQIIDRER
ncbi:MAG: histidine phosphatase family protein, partial [Actinobacteria bacterium]|nr:histidine phosphatase family protein [Actinomycetota bacterium]